MGGEILAVSAQLWRVDSLLGGGAREEIRIATQVLLEEIDAPAVVRHYRRVREREAVVGVELEDLVLRDR